MHPWLFAGGAAAVSVPVIIHLLNRRRFKVVEWAAMKFLWESVRKNRRRLRLEELILLVLRCLAIFLLAVAVSRFLGCAPPAGMPIASGVETTHVFILDDSVSMGQKVADTTAFKKAASDLAEALAAIPSTDHVAVLLTSRPQRSQALWDLKDILSEPEALGGRLKALEVSDTRAQLAEALATAAETFELVSAEKRLYVLGDFRRVDFGSPAETEGVRKQLQKLRDQNVRIVLMNYGAAPGPNLTAEKIEVLNKLVIASVPVSVQLTVRNNGPTRAENVSVSFSAQAAGVEMRLPARTIPFVDAGQSQVVQVDCELPDPGAAVFSAELPADTVAGDNKAYLAMDVRKARQVLVVDGEPDLGDPAKSESFYLAAAIDPRGDQNYGSAATVVASDQVAEVDFNRYDAVVLANVPDIPLSQLDSLTKYVLQGGGLAVFTGDRVDPTFYNGPFYDKGAGLCPMRLAGPVEPDRHRRQVVHLSRDSIANDPVMRVFQGHRSQFTRFVRFFGYTPADELAPPTAGVGLGPVRVLARFDNEGGLGQHSPAVVTRACGKGQVMMVCSSADIEWTDWPKDLTFVPFINDLLNYICRPGGGGLTAPVGERIDHSLGPDLAAAKTLLRTPAFPAEDVVALEGRWVGQRRQITYAYTRHAGVYQLRLDLPGKTRTVLFARNSDSREGRLEQAPAKQLASVLGVEFEYVDKLSGEASGQSLRSDQREYWKLALAVMLAVLAVEVFLGQRFGHYR